MLTRRTFLRASTLALGAAALPLPTLAADPTVQVQVRTYHEIDYGAFKAELLGLLNAGYQPISIESLVGALNGSQNVPAGLKGFHITWDDARLSQYTNGWRAIKEIQQEHGVVIPVTAFLITMFDHLPLDAANVPDSTPCYTELGPRPSHKFMTKGQAVELIANGVHAGSHTVDHADLPRLSLDGVEGQLVTAETRIQALWDAAGVKRPVKVLAYPYGAFTARIVSTVQSLGYDAAFSTRATTTHSARDRFILGRVGSVESSAGVI